MSTLLDRNKNGIYIFSGLYILLNSIFIAMEQYWFMLIPIVIAIIYLGLTSLDKLFLVIVFFTPLALNLEGLDMGLAISVPTEPLIFFVMVLFFIKLLFEGGYPREAIFHPVSALVIAHLFWMFITSVLSEMPMVSFKFLLARTWFTVVFYFLALIIFRNKERIFQFLWLYIIPLCGVIIYTIINHSQYGFNEETGHWVMSPFYKDHTAYGALLAMMFPVVIMFTVYKDYKPQTRILIFILFFLYTIAIILSYTRAAWLSLIAAAGVYLIFKLKIKWQYIGLVIILGIGTAIYYQDSLFTKFKGTTEDSSNDLAEHVQSIGNVTSDASNLERINRWNSALRMFAERPLTGFGPGTYMFQYAPFQHSKELTIISTNSGDAGNAHSEYLGPLAEQGILGFILIVILCGYIIHTGVRVYQTIESKSLKGVGLAVFLGLITYLVHGILNNFLDTDKASVPFWGFTSILVALDIFYPKKTSVDAAGK